MAYLVASDGTVAEYFRRGVELGLISESEVRAWADTAIASRQEPPYELIEVAWSKNAASLLLALAAVVGDRDPQLAGSWLFDLLLKRIRTDTESVARSVRCAMNVARLCEFDDDVYYSFDNIDDSLFLARHGQLGTVAECSDELVALLRKYAKSFPAQGEA